MGAFKGVCGYDNRWFWGILDDNRFRLKYYLNRQHCAKSRKWSGNEKSRLSKRDVTFLAKVDFSFANWIMITDEAKS